MTSDETDYYLDEFHCESSELSDEDIKTLYDTVLVEPEPTAIEDVLDLLDVFCSKPLVVTTSKRDQPSTLELAMEALPGLLTVAFNIGLTVLAVKGLMARKHRQAK